MYDIELDWDYAYVVVSTDNGATWTPVPTNLSTDTDPNGQNFGHGITGSTGGDWVDLTADLTGFSGNVLRRLPLLDRRRRQRDGPAGSTTSPCRAWPSTAPRRTPAGPTPRRPAASASPPAPSRRCASHYYVAEYRTYKGYDIGLKVGPYFFGYANTMPQQGRPLLLPGRPADQLLGHVPGRQRDRRAPGAGSAPARGRPLRAALRRGRRRCGATASRPTTRPSRWPRPTASRTST